MGTLSSEQKKFLAVTQSQYADHLGDAAAWLRGRGIEKAVAVSEGLGVVRNPPALHEAYEGMLAIPYLTEFGCVNMTFRCIKEGCEHLYHGKVNKMEGWDANLYGVRSIADADEWIAVTEGEIDRISLVQIGIPAVCIPGVKSWKEHWANVFEDFSRIYVFEDGDVEGRKLPRALRDRLDVPVIGVGMPDGEDVNSMLAAGHAEWLKSRIRK